MIEILKTNELLLLFLVIAIGYSIGNIKIKGNKLGVAAVLFVGLGFGGLDASLTISSTVFLIGLVMFVYTIGLSNGPAFFKNIRRSGFRDILFVIGMLTLSGLLTVGVFFLFGMDKSTAAGLFAGSTTNTPALAGLLDTIGNTVLGDLKERMIENAVIAYSLSYPMGVLGSMIAISLMSKWLKVDFKEEEKALRKDFPTGETIDNKSVLITNPDITGISIRDLMKIYKWSVVFGRIRRSDETELPNWDTRFQIGDKITVVGTEEQLAQVLPILGDVLDIDLSDDRSEYGVKRIFVSNPDIAGKSIASLNLPEKFSAIISRVRRGDVDVLADNNSVLELGDQIRFVARRKELNAISKFFGDSYESLSQINLFSFGFGIALGLLLGMVVIQLPGGIGFSLGFAGGPLIVALILGSLRRTGSIVWTLPYSASLTLRQLGLILLLASIGVRSGHQFFSTIMGGGAGFIFLGGTIISLFSALITLLVGYKIVKIPFTFLMGMVANQPAILDFALAKSENNLPSYGYTMMFPIALIIKILYVQLLYMVL